MKELPKYAFLESEEIEGKKVICLEPPYFVANVRAYKRDQPQVSDAIEDLAHGRYPIAKVYGYTIFLTMFTSLQPCADRDLQQDALDEMAKWFYTERVLRKPGTYMKSEETGKVEERIVMRGRIMRERKNKAKNE